MSERELSDREGVGEEEEESVTHPNINMWSCTVCTLENHDGVVRCQGL